MNREENILRRLLKAAGKAQAELPETIPFRLETRILAGWRSAAMEEEWAGVIGYFRRAVVCSVLVMVASFGWSQFSIAHEVPGAIAFSNLAQVVQIVP